MFGDDMSLAMRLILALVIVLALIGFVVLLLRRFGMVRIGAVALHGRQPRLAVMDVAHLDTRRKLVIVRRDTVEHLLMIGGPNDVVIEQNIIRGQPVHKEEKSTAAQTAAAKPGPIASTNPDTPAK